IRGTGFKFNSNSDTYETYGSVLDVDNRAFFARDRRDGWQKIEPGIPSEYLMQKTNEPRPPQPHVATEDWPLNLNHKPEHPWKWPHYIYLLDKNTGEFLTFWTNTTGGRVAVNNLSGQIIETSSATSVATRTHPLHILIFLEFLHLLEITPG